eukprot:5110941-Pyramimonas_sp.AAC.1
MDGSATHRYEEDFFPADAVGGPHTEHPAVLQGRAVVLQEPGRTALPGRDLLELRRDFLEPASVLLEQG